MESEITGRNVYLPPGTWFDYQTRKKYDGGWHYIESGEIPVVMMVRGGSIIPHVAVAQSTKDINWTEMKIHAFTSEDVKNPQGALFLPSDDNLQYISLEEKNGKLTISNDPYKGKVNFEIKHIH